MPRGFALFSVLVIHAKGAGVRLLFAVPRILSVRYYVVFGRDLPFAGRIVIRLRESSEAGLFDKRRKTG